MPGVGTPVQQQVAQPRSFRRVALGACCACVEKVQSFFWIHLLEGSGLAMPKRIEELRSRGE